MSLPISPRVRSFFSVAIAALTLATVGGCSSQGPAGASFSPKATAAPQEHEHKAPHGGTLVELGEEFGHVELVVDPGSGKITAYILDGEAEESVRIKQPELELQLNNPAISLKLSAVPNVLTGESVGDTSEFSAQSDSLKGVTAFDGVLKKIETRGSLFENVTFSSLAASK